MRTKVTVVGAGLTGRTIAQEVARRDYANVVLVDIVENLPQGIALDLTRPRRCSDTRRRSRDRTATTRRPARTSS